MKRDFPITRLTAAIIHVDPKGIESLFDLSETVADAKRISKRPGGDGIAEVRYAPSKVGGIERERS